MNNDLEQKAEQIFNTVRVLSTAEHPAALADACANDDALLARVQALLNAADHANAFLAAPTVTSSLEKPPATIEKQIGRYRILERIGGGGMGDVYVAEQTEPIKRRVAIKVIKTGMDTRAVVARFEAERQALAMMDHPNIARVFDAGATDAGRPYFVMELVRGVPITTFCDDNKLTTRQRVELMVPVCQAVQHAHQKGIIHRDIKPGNVLVTLHDGKPVPKVIDFGIAKATTQPLTDKTVYTEFRAMIGTPAYMSPEQAEMSGLDIDTRSDIYSLGVLAYELLTGALPFDSARLVKAGLGEIQRIIREEDPPRPSIRVSTMGERLTTIAKSRDVEPSKLSKLVAGELDWIVMRAMEKDRKRRYDSATDLAADLNRHLDGEPVEAAPPTWAYRAKKFTRKHRGAVIAAATVTVSLISGVIGTGWEWHRATSANHNLQETVDFTTTQMEEFLVHIKSVKISDYGDMASVAIDIPEYVIDFDHPGVRYQIKVLHDNALSKVTGIKCMPVDGKVVGSGTRFMIQSIREMGQNAFDFAEAQTSSAQMEAYTADLALAQSAMASGNWPEARGRLDACPETKRGWEWTFLRKQADRVKSRPSPYERSYPSGDFRKKLVLSGLSTVNLVDADSNQTVGKPLEKFPASTEGFNSNTLRISYRGEYALLREEAEKTSKTVANFDPGIHIWDTASGKQKGMLPNSDQVMFSTDGRFLITADDRLAEDGTVQGAAIKRWSLPDCKLVDTLNTRPFFEVEQAPADGSILLISRYQDMGTVDSLWNVRTGKLIKELEGFWGPHFSADGRQVAAATAAGTRVWNSASGDVLFDIKPDVATESFVTIASSAVYSPDGTRLLILTTVNDKSFVRMADASTGTPTTDSIYVGYCDRVEFTSDGGFSTSSGDERVDDSLWSIDGVRQAVRGKPADWTRFPDDSDAAVDHIWPGYVDFETDAEMADQTPVVTSSAVVPKPVFTVTPTNDGFVQLASLADNTKTSRIGSTDSPITASTLSPDGSRLVTGDQATIRFYDTTNSRELVEFAQPAEVRQLQFTPDGTRLIVHLANGRAQVWDPRPLEERRKMWARRAAERTPAREYVARLLAGTATTRPADLQKLIREDATITPLRKLVAMEVLDVELRRRQRDADVARPATVPAR